MDIELLVQMRQSDKCRSVRNDIFNLHLGCGAGTWVGILNILHLIVSNGYWYCYCNKENENKCKLCTIPTILFDFEQDIDFLKFYYSRLCHELRQLFDEDQSAIECFFHQEYQFRGERLDIWGNLGCLSLSLKA